MFSFDLYSYPNPIIFSTLKLKTSKNSFITPSINIRNRISFKCKDNEVYHKYQQLFKKKPQKPRKRVHCVFFICETITAGERFNFCFRVNFFYQIFKMQRRSILLCYFHNTHRYILNIYLYRRVFSLRIKLHFYSPLSNYVRKMFAARKSVLNTEMIYIKNGNIWPSVVLFKKKLKK